MEKELGERRAVGFSGVGLGVSEQLDFEAMSNGENNIENGTHVSYSPHYSFAKT